jgi:hypothetical protein
MEVLGIPRDGTAVGLGLHPFAPERTLVLPSGRRLRDACESSGRSAAQIFEALERRWAERGYPTEPMAPEKQGAIAWIIDGMTRHYHRTELFDEWATALMGRESLGSTGMGCHFGLPHQFQHRAEVEVDGPPIDWWLILCPDGIDWESLADEPVHMLFAHVGREPWASCRSDLYYRAWGLSCRVAGDIEDCRPISRMGRLAAARSLNPIVLRTLATMDQERARRNRNTGRSR